MEGVASAYAAKPQDSETSPGLSAPDAKTLVIPRVSATPPTTQPATSSPPKNKSRSRKELAPGAAAAVRLILPRDTTPETGFFYKGPVAHRGQAYVVSGEAAVLPAPEEKGPINPPPLKGSAFQFIPACFRSLWFLFLCAGMIPATMTTVVKDQKGILWKGVQFVSIIFVLLSAGFLISTILSTSSSPSEIALSPALAPWDQTGIFDRPQRLNLEMTDPTQPTQKAAEREPAIYSPNSTSAPVSLLPTVSSGIISTATLGVKKGMRKVLIDSGANILLAPNDSNMTDITKKTYHVTGVHGTSSLDFVGRLPTLVTNMGDKLHFDVECPQPLG